MVIGIFFNVMRRCNSVIGMFLFVNRKNYITRGIFLDVTVKRSIAKVKYNNIKSKHYDVMLQ